MAEREADVNPFSYTEETLEEIEGALSPERLQPYLDAFGGDRESALRLYLWNTAATALRQVFAHCATLTRRQAHGPLNELRILRNRIAHHEPIFMRNLTADHARILEVIGWISPGVRTWIAHHSRLPALLELPRDAGAIQF